jgi:hypothetical protein
MKTNNRNVLVVLWSHISCAAGETLYTVRRMCSKCCLTENHLPANYVKTDERDATELVQRQMMKLIGLLTLGGREGKWVHPHVNIISCLALRSANVPHWTRKITLHPSGRHCSFVFRMWFHIHILARGSGTSPELLVVFLTSIRADSSTVPPIGNIFIPVIWVTSSCNERLDST